MKRVDLVSVSPLRKRNLQGQAYKRRPDVEALLAQVLTMPRHEVLERAQIRQHADPAYLPSECLLHLLRASRVDNSERRFERLYKILFDRVRRCLPRSGASGRVTESAADVDLQEKVLGRFAELLSADRREYDERLDYFEINFDGALAKLRLDAQRQVWREASRHAPLTYDEESGEPSAEVEDAARRFADFTKSRLDDPAFRLRLHAAIDSLPTEQSRIIYMLIEGFPIDSQDPQAVTIARSLERSEKTVRSYRDKAIATLRCALDEGEEK